MGREDLYAEAGHLIRAQIADYQKRVGGFEIASLQVNFNTLSFEDARRCVDLIGREVIPRFT
jgi:hypothetical protein